MRMIEGVEIIPCTRINNERGFLQEILRNDDPFYSKFGQAYITNTKQGICKAWYRHKVQTDYIFVINGTMKLALYDDREDSETFQCINEFVIQDSQPSLVKIPHGIWHGFKAEKSDLLLLHLNSESFDFENTDEERRDPDSELIPYSF